MLSDPGALTSFKALADSTAEDWAVIMPQLAVTQTYVPEHILEQLRYLRTDYGGFPVDRLQHSLQTAELCAAAGCDDEYVVCALLHDIGDTLGSANHPDVAAAILYPYVSEANHWMVKHHGVFQGYNFFHHLGMDRNMRDQYRGTAFYEQTEEFIAKYDDPAFDAEKPKLDLNVFAPLVRRVFEKPINTLYKALR